MKKTLALLVVGLLAVGCVRKTTTHTLYIDPDGAVNWMVLEKDIRSDAAKLEERNKEEAEFMEARRSDEHDMAEALAMLDPDWVETRILRDERPYMVATEARFESLDRVLQSFFDQAGAPISAELHRDGDRVSLTISCDLDELDAARQGETDEEQTEVLMALVDDADAYVLVLTDGKFVSARGFEIKDDGTVALPQKQSREDIEAIQETDDEGRTVIYSLTWMTPKTQKSRQYRVFRPHRSR